MRTEAAHDCILLAAGASTRLGQPKQLLRRQGETLIHRCARLARATQPQRLLIVVATAAANIRAALANVDAELIENSDWQRGLSGSLQLAALQLATSDRTCLLLGCDQPALELAHLNALLSASAQAASGCAALSHQGMAALPAAVSPQLLKTASALQGDRGLRAALRALPRASIALLDYPELQRDIDDEEDLAAAIRAGWIDGDP
jgi:molybdenum cofactor cytidylyltransferase